MGWQRCLKLGHVTPRDMASATRGAVRSGGREGEREDTRVTEWERGREQGEGKGATDEIRVRQLWRTDIKVGREYSEPGKHEAERDKSGKEYESMMKERRGEKE